MLYINDTDFNSAWARAIRSVLRDGTDMVIGDQNETKPIRDTCMAINLSGNAINQITNGTLHPQFPFKHTKEYCETFTYEYQKEYMKKSESEKFVYTYFQRFTSRNTVNGVLNQLQSLKENLECQISTGISSNRNIMITWEPENDIGTPSPPCLQCINLRYEGRDKVSVKLHWRSHDLFSAWQINIIGIIKMLNDYIIFPSYCVISDITEFNDSLHIYKSDQTAAEKVKLFPVSPLSR